MSLTEIMTPQRSAGSDGGDCFTANVPDTWQQGRGAFGGLTLGMMTRALMRTNAESGGGDGERGPARRLRSLTAELLAPVVPGPALLEVVRLREGGGITSFAVTMLQAEGGAVAHAVGVFGKDRGTTRTFAPDAPPAVARGWRALEPPPLTSPPAPRFALHFEYRLTGQVPFMGASVPETEGWVRPRDPCAERDEALIVALADAWWPSSLVTETTPRPFGTVTFTLEILSSLAGLDPEAPLFHRGRTVAGAEGYLVDFRELWGDDGRLVALNQQTVVVVK